MTRIAIHVELEDLFRILKFSRLRVPVRVYEWVWLFYGSMNPSHTFTPKSIETCQYVNQFSSLSYLIGNSATNFSSFRLFFLDLTISVLQTGRVPDTQARVGSGAG